MTAEMYKVLPIEGKGLGAVASKFIKKGTLILNEKPQISLENDPEIPLEIHIRQVISCFYEMSESDQNDFMKLYDKFDGDTVKSESNLGLALREGLLEISCQHSQIAEDFLYLYHKYISRWFKAGINIP